MTVYYKHGEWGTNVFNTLREGLLDFVDSTVEEEEEKAGLISLNDKDLADRLLEIGIHTPFISGHVCTDIWC